MSKSSSVKLTVTDDKDKRIHQVVSGRLIGFVDSEELRAIINSKDAARKIFSAETISEPSVVGIMKGKRIVIASTNYSKSLKRAVYISPEINYQYLLMGHAVFNCKGNVEIAMETE